MQFGREHQATSLKDPCEKFGAKSVTDALTALALVTFVTNVFGSRCCEASAKER